MIQTYTVEFERDGTPTRGHIIGRLKKSDHRFLANDGDENTLRQLASGVKEQVGRCGFVRTVEDGRTLFVYNDLGKL